MSATQVALIVLVVVAFAVGWFARGRRARAGTTASAQWSVAEIDAALGAALTAAQAALAALQLDDAARSPLAHRTIEAFQQRCAVVSKLATNRQVPRGVREPLAHAGAELDRLAEELTAHEPPTPLDPARERRLLSAERRLAAARSALLLAVVVEGRGGPSPARRAA